jgi:hypothetical protein
MYQNVSINVSWQPWNTLAMHPAEGYWQVPVQSSEFKVQSPVALK